MSNQNEPVENRTCPLLRIALWISDAIDPKGTGVSKDDCLKEKCEWWVKGFSCCSLPAIVNELCMGNEGKRGA